jgi:hypothetical protein
LAWTRRARTTSNLRPSAPSHRTARRCQDHHLQPPPGSSQTSPTRSNHPDPPRARIWSARVRAPDQSHRRCACVKPGTMAGTRPAPRAPPAQIQKKGGRRRHPAPPSRSHPPDAAETPQARTTTNANGRHRSRRTCPPPATGAHHRLVLGDFDCRLESNR